MARAKQAAKKQAAKAKTAKGKATKGKAAKGKPATAAARKAGSAAGKRKATKAKAKAKAAPAIEVEDLTDDDSAAEMLDILTCPTATADLMCEICEHGIEVVRDVLPHVAAAELVWRGSPEQSELAGLFTSLIEELDRHSEVLGALYDRLQPLVEADAEHGDLDVAEVLVRMKPLLEHHAAMED